MSERESSKDSLHNLGEKLDQLCAGAFPDDIIDDEFVDALMEWLGPVEALSQEASHYAVTHLQGVMKDDALVASIERDRSSGAQEKTFGQMMNELRTKAGWNLATVAGKLGSDTSLIERLERDLVPLVYLAVGQWADLLELFHVRLREFAALAARTSVAQRLQQRLGPAYARSKTDADSAQHGRDLAFAIARALPDLDGSSKGPLSANKELIESLDAELRRRQRLDLLRG